MEKRWGGSVARPTRRSLACLLVPGVVGLEIKGEFAAAVVVSAPAVVLKRTGGGRSDTARYRCIRVNEYARVPPSFRHVRKLSLATITVSRRKRHCR
jgi:hypothetical protein